MNTEQQVATHYTHGSLLQTILNALTRMGKDPERFAATDLATGDELHLGWLPATAALAKDLGLAPGMHVLDVGSGIGGPARYFADAHQCRVTGIDLTEEFVATATDLTRRCGLSDLVTFRQGSALDLPFDAATFDAATLIHVGMNIKDKARLFGEVRRVLKSGAPFGVCGCCSGVGLATVVGRVALARTALAGALAHGSLRCLVLRRDGAAIAGHSRT